MKRNAHMAGTAAAIGMLILILDGKTAIQGASEGLELCIRTVIPALFPFLLLSNQIMAAFSGEKLPLLRPLGALFSLPAGAESLLVPAFLGGYPVGAQCIGNEYAKGRISKSNAERLLAFCSNAGPSFLFGMVGSMFPEKWMVWALWGIQILSALLVSGLFSCNESVKYSPEQTSNPIMISSVKNMGIICGWVLVFRVIIAFMERWWLWILPTSLRVVLMGLLELTNGCCCLKLIESISLRFLVCAGMLSFGGICVLLQTASVAKGLSIRHYVTGKLLQTLISLFLAAGFLWNSWITTALVFGYFFFSHAFTRKNSRNSMILGV